MRALKKWLTSTCLSALLPAAGGEDKGLLNTQGYSIFAATFSARALCSISFLPEQKNSGTE